MRLVQGIKIKEESMLERLHFKEIELEMRLTVLVGGNGVGKSTLLECIEKGMCELKGKEGGVEIKSYINSRDNLRLKSIDLDMSGVTGGGLWEGENVGRVLSSTLISRGVSEGQSIIHNFLIYIERIKEYLSQGRKILLLLDEIESGLSVEHINMVLHILLELLSEYENVQIIMSSTSYHIPYVLKKVLNMYTGEYIEITSYEEYVSLHLGNMGVIGEKNSEFLNMF